MGNNVQRSCLASAFAALPLRLDATFSSTSFSLTLPSVVAGTALPFGGGGKGCMLFSGRYDGDDCDDDDDESCLPGPSWRPRQLAGRAPGPLCSQSRSAHTPGRLLTACMHVLASLQASLATLLQQKVSALESEAFPKHAHSRQIAALHQRVYYRKVRLLLPPVRLLLLLA